MGRRVKLGAVCLLLLFPALVQAESLAEIARKAAEARERREGNDKAAKVYGDDDLKGEHERRRREAGAAPTLPDSPAAEPQAAAASEVPDAAEVARELDRERQQRADAEVRWRKRLNEANQRLDEARKRYDAIKDVTLHRGEKLVDEKDQVIASSPGEVQHLVDAARGEIEAAQQALDDLLESARRAGVPPGWLR